MPVLDNTDGNDTRKDEETGAQVLNAQGPNTNIEDWDWSGDTPVLRDPEGAEPTSTPTPTPAPAPESEPAPSTPPVESPTIPGTEDHVYGEMGPDQVPEFDPDLWANVPIFDGATENAMEDVAQGEDLYPGGLGPNGSLVGDPTLNVTPGVVENPYEVGTPEWQGISDANAAAEAEAALAAQEKIEADAATLREIMQSNIDDPNAYLADRGLLQEYTLDNSFLKNADGTLILDADGQPQEDVSLSMDPRYYQLEASNLAELVRAGTITAGQAAIAAAANFETSLIDIDSLSKNIDKIALLEPMKAASMAKHLNALLEGMEEGNIPMWARPAVAKVEQALAGRGISASSIGRDSLFNAIIQAAMPIAQQDATFEQEANKEVYNAKVNAIFEDTKIEFAAKQFNAKSKNEAAALMAQLGTQVSMANADRADRMAQFNTDQGNQTERYNAGQANQMTQFQANLDNNREQFNSNMSAQIDGATLQWRRQMNSANTAGVNAVNQANVQQAFNLNNQALSNLWQEQRDQAHWMFQASENEKNRQAQLEAAVLSRESSTAGEIGGFLEGLDINGEDILNGVSDAWDWVSGLGD